MDLRRIQFICMIIDAKSITCEPVLTGTIVWQRRNKNRSERPTRFVRNPQVDRSAIFISRKLQNDACRPCWRLSLSTSLVE